MPLEVPSDRERIRMPRPWRIDGGVTRLLTSQLALSALALVEALRPIITRRLAHT
jgi:hypothetical protein